MACNRRAFITAGTAAALMTACDKRTPSGPDVRRPSAPRGLAAAFSGNAITLTWALHDNTDTLGTRSESAVRIIVLRNGTRITELTAGTTSYVDTAITLDARYEYALLAVDSAGNESDPSASVERWARLGNVRICKVTDITASSGSALNAATVTAMLHRAVRALTGITDTGLAWERFFPGLTMASTIGIKINTLAGAKLSTHPAVVEAIVDGLTRMLSGTFPAYNIIVFDDRTSDKFTAAGFTLRDTPGLYRCVTSRDDWSAQFAVINGVTERFSAVAESVDFIVNVPVLKDHNEAGVTFALKNFYGLIENPGLLHANFCDPFVAQVYNRYRDKVKLVVGDCIFGAHRNGPDASPTFVPNALLVGTDPVALDVTALSMINAERARRGMAMVSAAADGHARHISTAAAAPYTLGEADASNINVEAIA
ncbi:MAG: DUF362 domain-containing protein [Fibrobacterota bacterium]